MAQKIDVKKIALSTGIFLGAVHAIWAICVAITRSGVQAFMDWVLLLHSISMPMSILPFNLLNSIMLVVVTFVIGCLFGWIFAHAFNYLHRR